MKTLIVNNESYVAEKIIKTDNEIIGQDSRGNEVFAFRGISDFSLFVLEEGQDFDNVESSEQDLINSQLLIENAQMKTQLEEQQELTSQLLLDIATLKGGSASV